MTSLTTWLALTQVPALNSSHLNTLQKNISLDELVTTSITTLQKLKLTNSQQKQLTNINWRWVNESEKWLQTNNHHLIPYTHIDYP